MEGFNNFKEKNHSQKETLELLQQLGYTYLSVEEVNAQREGFQSRVLLKGILREQLEKINQYNYRGESHAFSSANIEAAIKYLAEPINDGLLQINKGIFELLMKGRSYEEIVHGQKKSFNLQYIDWHNWQNNVFHITQEMTVKGINSNRRLDVVLFVNGIPFVIIENKRSDVLHSAREAISQHIRNQTSTEGIPQLFYYAQLLLAVEPNQVYYGTTKTKMQFWSVWKEEGLNEQVQPYKKKGFLPSEQDRILYALCRPERLLELVQQFIIFDKGVKKIARYQQYFAIKATLERIQHYQNNQSNKRQGGVIWHTQGSGKSLTMVMLSKAIKLDRSFPKSKVVLVTDRVSLDKQIHETFHQCGIKNLKKAGSGKQLAELIADDNIEVVTAIINKFGTAKEIDYAHPSNNIFVLIDESHRSQYGESHAYLKQMLPNACLIGFTGTPLNKKEKSTAQKFGGFIHQYTIDQAVEDGAVLPILYEGRKTKMEVYAKALDRKISQVEESLPDYVTASQKEELRKKYASITAIYGSINVVEEIANDIAQHFNDNIKDGHSKAQIAVHNISTAIKYQEYFEKNKNRLQLNTRVVFSSPSVKEEYTEVADHIHENNKQYLDRISKPYGNPKKYEEKVIEEFKEAGTAVELLIVVDKYLTGFDAPRNTVLYIIKPLKDHNLLQAIARVNRLFEGKDYGYVIDYMGILGNLDKALTDYQELSGFDEEDVAGALLHAREAVEALKTHHHQLWQLFEGVNQEDLEAMMEKVRHVDKREEFQHKLTKFARALKAALTTDEYIKSHDKATRLQWEADLKYFMRLNISIKKRLDEPVNFKEYKRAIEQLMDRFVMTEEIEQLTTPINIFDEKLRLEELLKTNKSPASLADQIAHKMKHTVTEKMDEDLVFYKNFSELIKAVIEAYEEGRLKDKEYLERVLAIQKDLKNGNKKGIPPLLQHRPQARAFYRVIEEVLKERKKLPAIPEEALAQLCLEIDDSISKIATVDWKKNTNKLAEIANCIDDYLLDGTKHLGLDFNFSELDYIIEVSKRIAKANY